MDFQIRDEKSGDGFAINKIINQAFGPGRHAKTAYRIREGAHFQFLFGLVAYNKLNHIIGTVRVSHFDSSDDASVLLGPIAVDPRVHNMGVGMALIECAKKKSQQYPIKNIILIGDLNYYKRFGFSPMENTDFLKPFPMNPNKILIHQL